MLKGHVNILHNNITTLANNTNVSTLVPKLVSNNVFSQEMVDRILSVPNSSGRLQAISLYLDTCRRGPHAFEGLIRALMESDHEPLADLLKLDASALPRVTPSQLPLQDSAQQNDHVEDSLDSSPSRAHSCRIPHSVTVSTLPNYLNPLLREELQGHHCEKADIIDVRDEWQALDVVVKTATKLQVSDGRLPEKYRMTSKPRGYALLINNIRFDDEDYPIRNGAHNDGIALTSLFKQFYFTVESHTNKTRREMSDIVRDFAGKIDWIDKDCAFIVLMSHGKEGDSEEDTEIIGTDGLGLKTRDIVSYFYNDNCPLLINKPKVFIFQSCRGSLSDSGVEVDLLQAYFNPYHRTETDGRRQRHTLGRDRSRSDIFIAHPVPPGIKANRDRFAGAWFIQIIVRVFAEYAHSCDLEDLFKIVDQHIKRVVNMGDPNYQTVTTKTIGWSKKLFLNPGLHLESGQLVRMRPNSEEGMDVVDTPSLSHNNGNLGDQVRLTKVEDEDDSQTGCYRCRPS